MDLTPSYRNGSGRTDALGKPLSTSRAKQSREDGALEVVKGQHNQKFRRFFRPRQALCLRSIQTEGDFAQISAETYDRASFG